MSNLEADDENKSRVGKKIGEGGKEKARDLVSIVFSWSLEDVFNKNLLKDKASKIPETFTSLEHYLGSYTFPLIEEVHADLLSTLEALSQSPFTRIQSVEKQKLQKNLLYKIVVERGTYRPMKDDLFVISDVRPKHVSDLTVYGRSYIIASVDTIEDDLPYIIVKTSQPLVEENQRGSPFAVFLLNITTYNRMWVSLKMSPGKGRGNASIFNKILGYNSSDVGEGEENSSASRVSSDLCDSNKNDSLYQFKLNTSQLNAVVDCISARQQHQGYSTKFIWGPPGTGKTKTISSLLWVLLTKKCQTVTCAPTNTAVVEVASRLVKLVRDSPSGGSCMLRDVVLFGNKNRMKIGDNLSEVYLDHRVDRLSMCFMPLTGWRHCVGSMIYFLEACVTHYKKYLKDEEKKEKEKRKQEKIDHKEDKTYKMTFKEFVACRFESIRRKLAKCIITLYKDLPTASTSEVMFENMNLLLELINSFGTLIRSNAITDNDLRKLFQLKKRENYDGIPAADLLNYIKGNEPITFKLQKSRYLCLQVLRSIQKNLNFPKITGKRSIRSFCLRHVTLIFCTASSSFSLRNVKMKKPLEFLVVDEAAQLKECESVIPLQLSSIKHAIFIGDEYQLPAMVKSKISDDAAFGRSLFERLTSLGQQKHLLDVQYRMHPSISKFPLTSFYNNRVLDGPNVVCKTHERQYLSGPMYGAYSFINIARGKESTDTHGQSRKNMIEVANNSFKIPKFDGCNIGL